MNTEELSTMFSSVVATTDYAACLFSEPELFFAASQPEQNSPHLERIAAELHELQLFGFGHFVVVCGACVVCAPVDPPALVVCAPVDPPALVVCAPVDPPALVVCAPVDPPALVVCAPVDPPALVVCAPVDPPAFVV